MKTKTLTGADLNRAVAMVLGLKVVRLEHKGNVWFKVHTKPDAETFYGEDTCTIPNYAGDITLAWPILEKHLICLDAGDGSFKGERKWSAWLACNAPVLLEDEVTAADPLTALLRAFVHSVYGDDIEMEA